MPAAAKTVAFYLPQFHPIEENDRAWGPGFSEWHNVVQARPRFRGHRQPVLPADLGFYDLRLSDTRLQQADLARTYGVDAFCWYHYWFDGRRLLHEPFDRMFANAEETFPFLLCWANEAWTKTWSGRSGQVIVRQHYSPADDKEHIGWLLRVFADPRYLRVDGRPVMLVYQPLDLPDARASMALWRQIASADAGLDLLLLAVDSFRSRISDPRKLGFDGVVHQQPALRLVRPAWRAAPRFLLSRLRLANRYPRRVCADYGALAARAVSNLDRRPQHFAVVAPGWDNSPRRGRGATILTGESPELYERWLRQALELTTAPLVFINAWNEWAEGAHLEPGSLHGRTFLEAHRNATIGS